MRGPEPDWRTANEKLLEQIAGHLAAARYGRAAELLEQLQHVREQQGAELSAQMLDVARGLCLACSQHRATAHWHQEAGAQAAERERELQDQLRNLLELLCGRDLSAVIGDRDLGSRAPTAELAPPQLGLPPRGEPPNLWQRLQGALPGLLGHRPPDAVASENPPEEDANRSAPFLARAKGVASLHSIPPEHQAYTLAQIETPEEEMSDAPCVVVYCLGQFRVYQDNHVIADWPSGKGKCIFKYMVANWGRSIPKDVLMELFWPGADPDAARNSLNVAIYGLRQALRAARPDFSHMLFQDDHYLLNPSLVLWVDFEEFLGHYEAGRSLERNQQASRAIKEYEIAEGLYQGDFLEEDLYEDWPMLQRESLRDSYLVILDRLSHYYLESQRYATCIHLCQRTLAKDDCREEAHRRLMRCYSRQGQPYLALRQYHRCVETLQRRLDVPPMDKTIALYQQIRDGQVA